MAALISRRKKMSEAMPNVSNAIAIKHVELGLQLSTAILITFAVDCLAPA
jgi:hypothetical protein